MKLRHHHIHPGPTAGAPARGDEAGERGASLVEYALLLALIAVVVFGAVSFFGDSTEGGFGRSKDCIEAAYAGQEPPENCQ